MKRQKSTPEIDSVGTRTMFPIPTELVRELIDKFASCDKCNFETGDYTNRRCTGCKILICKDCDVYWSKCTGKVNRCEEDFMWGENSYRIFEDDCIYMSGNKWCYNCVKKNRDEDRVCPKCHKRPGFTLY